MNTAKYILLSNGISIMGQSRLEKISQDLSTLKLSVNSKIHWLILKNESVISEQVQMSKEMIHNCRNQIETSKSRIDLSFTRLESSGVEYSYLEAFKNDIQ